MTSAGQFSLFERAQQHSVFFAILLGESVGSRACQLARDLSAEHELTGKVLAADRLHVSIYGVGEFEGTPPAALLAAASEAAASIMHPPFEVSFDHVATFGGGALAMVGGEGIAEINDFRDAIFAAMKGAGVGRRERQQFEPHVTLLYDRRVIKRRPIEPIVWSVSEFVLIDSLKGQGHYELIGRWPLTGRYAFS